MPHTTLVYPTKRHTQGDISAHQNPSTSTSDPAGDREKFLLEVARSVKHEISLYEESREEVSTRRWSQG